MLSILSMFFFGKENAYIMKRINNIIAGCTFFLLGYTSASAQLTIGNWTYTKIPIDTTSEASDPGAPLDSAATGKFKFIDYSPLKLIFSDSLHGYFFYTKFSMAYGVSTASKFQLFSFRTIDGGLTWNPMKYIVVQDSGYLDGNYGYFQCFPSGSESVFENLSSMLIHSANSGSTWSIINNFSNNPRNIRLVAAFDEKKILLWDNTQHKLLESFDGGIQFPVTLGGDTLFQNFFLRDDGSIITGNDNTFFDWSDNSHWSVVRAYKDSLKQIRGITTLITSDAGNRWKRFDYQLPTSRYFHGEPQFVKGSPYLYYFTCDLEEGAGNTVRKKDQKYFQAESMYGISYLYSPDYGKSWTPEYQFGKRRKAFEAVATNEVWMTVSKKDSITPTDYATLIVNTTDNGLTWKIDSSALNPSDIGVLDGRILAFSDPRHGWCCATNGYDMYIMRYVKPEVNAVRTEGDNVYGTSYYLSLYPNPADNQMNASILSHQIVQSVDIYDYLGRKANYTYTLEKNNAIIDTHKIPNGLYLARVVNSKGSSTSTFIVQH